MGTSIKQLAEQIEADNEIFKSLSNAEKRVVVARDCLQRLKLRQFTAVQGATCDMNFHFRLDFRNKSVKEIINKQNIPKCEACVKGGLFLSYVGRVNEFTFGEIHNRSNLYSAEMQKLLEIFDPVQLNGIEAAFEKMLICDELENDDTSEFFSNCCDYHVNIKCSDPEDILISICKNIIKNKGEFVPTDYVSPNARIK